MGGKDGCWGWIDGWDGWAGMIDRMDGCTEGMDGMDGPERQTGCMHRWMNERDGLKVWDGTYMGDRWINGSVSELINFTSFHNI